MVGEIPPLRQDVRDLSEEQMYLYLEGLKKFQQVSKDEPLSYYKIAGEFLHYLISFKLTSKVSMDSHVKVGPIQTTKRTFHASATILKDFVLTPQSYFSPGIAPT